MTTTTETPPLPYRYRRPKTTATKGLVPIDGNDLRIGDRLWTSPQHMFTVDGHWPFHCGQWVVVER
jgi:hypothetical protein